MLSTGSVDLLSLMFSFSQIVQLYSVYLGTRVLCMRIVPRGTVHSEERRKKIIKSKSTRKLVEILWSKTTFEYINTGGAQVY